MAGYNRIIMIGNLTRDPDYKQLASGQAVCRLGMASNRQFRNRQSGDMVQEVCYVDVDVWGAQAESCKQYLAKGRQVLVEGRLKLDTWQDQEGHNRSKHSIVADRVVFLTSGAGGDSDVVGAEMGSDALEPRNEVERELLSQLDEIKNRTKPVAVKPASVTGAYGAATSVKQPVKSAGVFVEQASTGKNPAAFKDEPPFQDDLPF